MTMRKSALALVAGALALGIAPDPVIQPASWAAENLIVADGPNEGNRWSADLTPYAVEILNNLSPDNNPHNRVAVKKSAQTGLTECGIAWIGSIIDQTPASAMVVFPTIAAVQDFNREKLTPTIEATECLRNKVAGARSRSAAGSTLLNKKFRGGSLTLTGANSAADLRSKTRKFIFCDEVDEWPSDLDGQGDPNEMVDARQIAYHATGDYMRLDASTPTVKGASAIDAAFLAGDQRYFMVPCPHCDEYQRLVFGGKDVAHGLKFSREWPHRAHYVCIGCGCVIEHFQKREMVLSGKWVATNPGPGRYPSYHIDALVSLLTTWDKLVEAFLKAKDDPIKLKSFTNLWLGEVWEERGDAPEWNRLYARRAQYQRRVIPAGGLVLTAAADVQGDGIFYEVVAWGAGEESWSIDVGFLPGDTGAPENPVWANLARVFQGGYADQYGNRRPIDLAGVDSGYNTDAVYNFVRRHSGVLALKGADGWGRPAIGTASDQDVNLKGRRVRRGLKVWHVGTWSLKSKHYSNLRQLGIAEGAAENPRGYCHFAEFHDDQYFRQITAEFLKEVTIKGRLRREWHARGPNHYLDCRVYNMALAAHPLLRLPDLTDDEWRQIARERATPPAGAQGDLEMLAMTVPPVVASPDENKSGSDGASDDGAARDAAGGDGAAAPYIGRRPGWLGR